VLARFQQGNTYMALVLAEDIISQLELLNSSLQAKKRTMSSMKAAVGHVLQSLECKRSELQLKKLHDIAVQKTEELDLSTITVPRQC